MTGLEGRGRVMKSCIHGSPLTSDRVNKRILSVKKRRSTDYRLLSTKYITQQMFLSC